MKGIEAEPRIYYTFQGRALERRRTLYLSRPLVSVKVPLRQVLSFRKIRWIFAKPRTATKILQIFVA